MVTTNANAPSNATSTRTTAAAASNQVVVQPGDTMFGLARRHGVELAELIRANPQVRDPDLIHAGTALTLPATARRDAAPAATTVTSERAAASPEAQRDARTRAASAGNQQAARIAAAAQSTPAPEASVVAAGKGVFQKGQEGPSIAALQERLSAVGYGVKTTSRYGATTEEVVKRFQRDHGVEQTGQVGATTLKALDQAELQSVRDRRLLLRSGAQSGAVAELQEKLTHAGFGVEKTGTFAETTEARVREFQSARGLLVDGVVGPQTLAALEGGAASPVGSSSEPTGTTGSSAAGSGQVSARGQEQMRRLLDYARTNNQGASRGRCFEYVWKYMSSSGYGKIDNYNDLPRMRSGLARDFSDYMNASPAHLREAGLQRLDSTLSPPIRSPHDPRIPPGAVIVVAPGSTGTAHPTAGDIVVKGSRAGEFINDGPAMYYGTSSNWQGQVFGVYVPE